MAHGMGIRIVRFCRDGQPMFCWLQARQIDATRWSEIWANLGQVEARS